MSCGYDSNIYLDRLRPTETFKLAILHNTQQFCLQFERQLPNFIEKEGGIVCQFESTHLFGQGTGIGSFFTSEQLVFNQARR